MLNSRVLTLAVIGLSTGLSACRTASTPPATETKSIKDILNIQRVNNDFLITCLDGTTQKIPASKFDTIPSVDICSQVLTSDCPPSIKYSNGQALRQSNSTFFYSNGRPLRNGGNIYYNSDKKQLFKNSAGVLFFSDGKTLRGSDGSLNYPSGEPLKRTNSIYYYPGSRVLKQNSGALYYPNGVVLKSPNTSGTRPTDGSVKSSSTFNYSSGSPLKTAAGAFFYQDQKPARSGSILYRPDKTVAVTPIMIEAPVIDTLASLQFGQLRYAVESTTDSYSLSLPTLTPEVGMLFEPKTSEFIVRYDLAKNEAPIILTFDEKAAPRIYLFISTGYKGERIVLFSSSLTSDFQCRAIHTTDD